VIGAFFTFVSLIVISAATKKDGKDNLTTKMNQPLMESDEEIVEKVDPVIKKDGT
jgi:hypothetical protein